MIDALQAQRTMAFDIASISPIAVVCQFRIYKGVTINSIGTGSSLWNSGVLSRALMNMTRTISRNSMPAIQPNEVMKPWTMLVNNNIDKPSVKLSSAPITKSKHHNTFTTDEKNMAWNTLSNV